MYFSCYTDIPYTASSENCPRFVCATAVRFHAYCGAEGQFPNAVAAGEGFLFAPFSSIQICDYCTACVSSTVQKDAPHKNNVFFKPFTKLILRCNHRSGHNETEHTESLLLLRRHLGSWSHGPEVRIRSELLYHTKMQSVSAADSVCCACVG
jgi:hypothetical protein